MNGCAGQVSRTNDSRRHPLAWLARVGALHSPSVLRSPKHPWNWRLYVQLPPKILHFQSKNTKRPWGWIFLWIVDSRSMRSEANWIFSLCWHHDWPPGGAFDENILYIMNVWVDSKPQEMQIGSRSCMFMVTPWHVSRRLRHSAKPSNLTDLWKLIHCSFSIKLCSYSTRSGTTVTRTWARPQLAPGS